MSRITYGRGAASDPFVNAAAITPSNSDDLPGGPCYGIWIGGAGDVAAVPAGAADGTVVTFKGCAAGSVLPGVFKRVMTASTATFMVALY